MAQRRYNPQVTWIEDKEAVAPPDNTQNMKNVGGTATRTAGGLVVPTAIRMGAGLGGFFGPVVGGATSGLGEIVAQKIEAPDQPINWPRVGVESAIGAVPIGKVLKAGKALKSAAYGAGLAGAGVVGRKATDKEPGSLSKWDVWDLGQLVLGSGMGVAASKIPVPGAAKQGIEGAIEEALKTTQSEAPRLNKGMRVGTVEGKPIYAKGTAAIVRPADVEAPAVSEARARATASTTKPASAPADIDRAIEAASDISKAQRGVSDKGDKAFLRRTAQAWQQEARNASATEKYLAGIAKETDREALQLEADRMKAWAQEAKNLNAVDDYNRALKNAKAVETRLAALKEGGAKAQTVVTKTSTKETPSGTVKATTVIKAGKTPAGPQAGGPQPTPPKPVVPVEPTAQPEVKPTAIYLGEQEGVGPMYNIIGGPRDKGTVSLKTLQELGIEVPPTTTPPPKPPARSPKKPGTPPAAPAPKVAPKEPPVIPGKGPSGGVALAEPPEQAAANALARAEAEAQKPAFLDPEAIATGRKLEQQVAAGKTDVPVTPQPSAAAPTPNIDEAVDAVLKKHYPPDFYNEISPVSKAYRAATAELRQLKASGADQNDILRASAATKELGVKLQNMTALAQADGRISADIADTVRQELKQVGKVPAAPKVQKAGMRVTPAKPVATPPEVPTTAPTQPLPVKAPVESIPIADQRLAELRQRIADNESYIKQIDADPQMDDITKELFRREAVAKNTQLQQELLQADPTMSAEPSIEELLKRAKGERGAIDPELAQLLLTRGAPAIGGAVAGSMYDEEHPLRGALVGGALGLGAGMGAGALAQRPDLLSTARERAQDIGRSLPNLQRFNLLSEWKGLGINSLLAPWGAGMMGSLENIGTGLAERGLGQVPSTALEEGVEGVKQFANPSYARRIKPSWEEAKRLLEESNERGEQLMGSAESLPAKIMSAPATVMATGDIASRGALEAAGLSEDAARAITLTANPRTTWGTTIVNYAKGHPMTSLIMPFSRTAVNSLESGMERIPLLGQLYNATLTNPEDKSSLARTVAMYGLSAGVAKVAYEIGQNIDPETARQWQVPKIVSNMAGQYGSVAATAYAAGVASRLGNDPYNAAASAAVREIPVPATNQILDTARSIGNYLKGEGAAHPTATTWPQKYLPNILVPGQLRDVNLQPMVEGLQRYNRQQKWIE